MRYSFRLLYLLFLLCLPSPARAACTFTSQLNLCLPAIGDTGWGTNYNNNFSTIDSKFHLTTGHSHTGAAGQGPKLGTDALNFTITTQAALDAHIAAANPHTVYCLKVGCIYTGPVQFASGTKTLPGFAFSFDPDSGFFSDGTQGAWLFSGNDEDILALRGGSGSGLNFDMAWGLGWTATGSPTAAPDAELWRVGAGMVGLHGKAAVRGGTDAAPNPHALTVFNYNDTTTPAYERMFMGFSSNIAYLETQQSGTGADNNPLHIRSAAGVFLGNSAARWQVHPTTHGFLPVATESYSIGSGSRGGAADLDPLDIYARGKIVVTHDNGAEFGTGMPRDDLVTIAAAAFSDSTTTIKADTTVCSVSARVTVNIPTATTFMLGVPGDPARYATGLGVTAGTTTSGMQAGCHYYSTATQIRITPNLTPATNTGRVSLNIHYLETTPADS